MFVSIYIMMRLLVLLALTRFEKAHSNPTDGGKSQACVWYQSFENCSITMIKENIATDYDSKSIKQ